ncbi:MAG: DUF4496 domain-containing protein [Bacteroidaceae bacterium]|nr:DUF4496 domain-containing protein [Bacteroidaceae bacterium]
MAIKVKARQTLINVGPQKGNYRFVMQTEIYNSLNAEKVMQEAALRSGLQKATVNAAWDAFGEVIKAWATEGHSVAVPGLGTMRFGVRATSVENVEDVSTNLITSRRVIFVPSVDIKKELGSTSINITCYDKDGKIIKQVTSRDENDVEEGEASGEGSTTGNENGNTQTPSTDDTGGGDSGLG